ncbi:protein-tyrosine phosphatase-like protein [Pavlovales sp. CCMP2436]|nr:protein-tyrosine phosphatase-like protein [Pavlovales sp. CCMP2436]
MLPPGVSFVVEFNERELEAGGTRRAEMLAAARAGVSKPWRKPAAAAAAERAYARRELGEGGGVSEIEVALGSLESALNSSGLRPPAEPAPSAQLSAARSGPSRARGTASARLAVMHMVLPGLWVGGWAALLNDCQALRERSVTHVVSVISADKRQLPAFVRGHYHALVDDSEEAAGTLATHFEPVCQFIAQALQSGGTCYVHCGAGISRAPTTATAYIMWARHLRATDALALVRKARQVARPNAGFVRALREWEKRLSAHAPARGGLATAEETPINLNDEPAAAALGLKVRGARREGDPSEGAGVNHPTTPQAPVT